MRTKATLSGIRWPAQAWNVLKRRTAASGAARPRPGKLRRLAGLALLALVAGPSVAQASTEKSELAWDWDRPHRYYVEAEVLLPRAIWFMSEFNKEQRTIGFQVRTVLACDAGVKERKRVREVMCTLEDVGLQAAGMPKKEGLLQPILEELDQRLTGAAVQIQVRTDGRLVNVDMEGLDRRNRRVGSMNENLRIVMSRTIAGLDLELPRQAPPVGEVWPQYQNWTMQAPSAVGTSGSSELLHKIREVRPDGTLLIESGGRGMIVPGGGLDLFETRFAAFAVFDPSTGALVERTWSAVGEPTASSASAEGIRGLKYVQRGRLKRLAEGEQVDVGETLEVTPPGLTPTTLQLWPDFGMTPVPMSR